MSPSELDYEDTIIDAAKTFGFLVHSERAARSKKGWRTPVKGTPGWFDLVIVGLGKAWFIELKKRPNKPTPEQILWATEMVRAGLDARLMYVPEELETLLMELQGHFDLSRMKGRLQRS